MKPKRLPHVLLALVALTACRERPAVNQATAPTDTARITAVGRCYGYAEGENRVTLKLAPATGDSVRGKLTYALAGKDRNEGTLTGRMRGDTLVGEYAFRSEGTASVREVVFLFRPDGVYEAVGPVAERSGRMEFTERRALRFDQMPPLRVEGCGE